MSKKVIKSPLTLLNSDERILSILNLTNEFLETHKSDIASNIDDLVWIFRSLHDLVPETSENLWSGHIFPLAEAQYELESSIVFCKLGFYKHAIGSLRNVLELGLLSVYWDIDGQSHVDIQAWLTSMESTPFRKKVFAKLKANRNIKIFDDMHGVFDETGHVYEQLCNFAHTKGIDFSSRALSTSNVNTFNEKSIERWLEFLVRVARIVVAFHILKYPVGLQHTPIDDKFGLNGPMGGFLLPYQGERIRKLYSVEVASTLQAVSDNDSDAVKMAEWVIPAAGPYPRTVASQIESQDRQEIEGSGFERWLRNASVASKSLRKASPDAYAKRLAYVRRMRAGATEHGFLKKGTDRRILE